MNHGLDPDRTAFPAMGFKVTDGGAQVAATPQLLPFSKNRARWRLHRRGAGSDACLQGYLSGADVVLCSPSQPGRVALVGRKLSDDPCRSLVLGLAPQAHRCGQLKRGDLAVVGQPEQEDLGRGEGMGDMEGPDGLRYTGVFAMQAGHQ